MSRGRDTGPDAPPHAHADIADLGYEEAREELVQIVARLEAGGAPLEEALELWERGEALAEHCQGWLDAAAERIPDDDSAED